MLRATLAGLTAVLTLPLAACGGSSSQDQGSTTLTVLGAASLTDVFEKAGDAYEKGHPDTRLRFSFAGSQELVAQVRQGAPADVLATADEASMAKVKSETGTPALLAQNSLTIVTAPGNPKRIHSLKDLSDPGLKVVLAASEVPVGKYAQQVLDRQGVDVRPSSQEADVRAVLSKVRLGEADAGIVYVTDAASAGDAVGTVPIPAGQNAIAAYPAATLKSSEHPEASDDFIDWLKSSGEARMLFQEAGFQRP